MARIFKGCSALVLLLSILSHICTFVPAVPISMHLTWPLHVGVMASFLAMMHFAARAFHDAEPKAARSRRWFFPWRERAAAARRFEATVRSRVPAGIIVLCVVTFFYAMLNFFVGFRLLEGGGPKADGGRFFLKNHGRIIRELTELEYRRMQAYEVRLFSGHWTFFSLIPTVYFVYAHSSTAQRLPDDGETESL